MYGMLLGSYFLRSKSGCRPASNFRAIKHLFEELQSLYSYLFYYYYISHITLNDHSQEGLLLTGRISHIRLATNTSF